MFLLNKMHKRTASTLCKRHKNSIQTDIAKGDAQRIFENAMYRAFSKDTEELVEILTSFWNTQKNALTYKEIRIALMAGNITVDYVEKWRQDYAKLINEKLRPKYHSINYEKCEELKKKIKTYDYDAHSYEFEKWVDSKCAGLITSATEEQKEAIKALIKRANANHLSVDEAAKVIRPCIGLTKSESLSNIKYYEYVKSNLIKSNPGMTIATAEKKAKEASIKLAEKQHRYRATCIARTELIGANNHAFAATIKDAESKGIVKRGKFVWSCTYDENSCEECKNLDGVSVDIGESFPVKGDEYYQGQHEAPPAHPNCGCSIYYVEVG